MNDVEAPWLVAAQESVASYRTMIDRAIEQLTDEEFFRRPDPTLNSVATIIRHLAGNLRSRWTDFFTTDGEKPDRNREREFEDWPGDRASLLKEFDRGWACLNNALSEVNASNIATPIWIRGEQHTLPQAITRSITHLAYHVGQILLVSRLVHSGQWQWLTIAPGASAQHNSQTWGTPASRGVAGPNKANGH